MVLCAAAEARQEGSALASAGAIQATKADDQVAQARQVARCMPGADGGKILTKRDVADAVETLDLPVTTPRGLNLSGVEAFVGSTAENDLHLLGDQAGFQMMGDANDESRLGGVGETCLLRSDGEGKDDSGLMPTVGLSQSDVRREKRLPSGRVSRVC